jgi:hypothetical protein
MNTRMLMNILELATIVAKLIVHLWINYPEHLIVYYPVRFCQAAKYYKTVGCLFDLV